MTLFGTSAKFIDAAHKAGIAPIKTHRLEHLRHRWSHVAISIYLRLRRHLAARETDRSGIHALVVPLRLRGDLPRLRELNLRYNQIGPVGAATLADAFQYFTDLTTLDIAGNAFCSAGLLHLVPKMTQLRRLSSLTINENECGADGNRTLVPYIQMMSASLGNLNGMVVEDFLSQMSRSNPKLPTEFENYESLWLAEKLFAGVVDSPIVFLLVIALLSTLFTTFMSNSAVIAILLPTAISMSPTYGIHPAMATMTVILPSNFAFILPIATPASALAYSSRFLTLKEMIWSGSLLSLFGLGCFMIMLLFYWPMIGFQ